MLHKLYVKIVLPEIALPRRDPNDLGNDLESEYLDAFAKFNLTREFMTVNIDAYRKAIDAYKAEGDTLLEMISVVTEFMASSLYNGGTADPFIEQLINDGFNPDLIYMNRVIDLNSSSKDELKNILDGAYQQSILIHKHYSDQMDLFVNQKRKTIPYPF